MVLAELSTKMGIFFDNESVLSFSVNGIIASASSENASMGRFGANGSVGASFPFPVVSEMQKENIFSWGGVDGWARLGCVCGGGGGGGRGGGNEG